MTSDGYEALAIILRKVLAAGIRIEPSGASNLVHGPDGWKKRIPASENFVVHLWRILAFAARYDQDLAWEVADFEQRPDIMEEMESCRQAAIAAGIDMAILGPTWGPHDRN